MLKRKKITPVFVTSLCEAKDLSGVKAIQYGIQNEENGINAFEEESGMEVIQSGLWLSESGVLGATPDGLVGETDLVEVKCPYK